jgi:phenylacetic acid degradation protein paaN
MTQSNQKSDFLASAETAFNNKKFFSAFPENPKLYPEESNEKGLFFFQSALNSDFNPLNFTDYLNLNGEEVSPYLSVGLGIKYPIFSTNLLIDHSLSSQSKWSMMSPQSRADVLLESLNNIKNRFFDIAYATMHTTGQSFMMSFQASGPQACDRALESIVLGLNELTRLPSEVKWVKPFGKFDLVLDKNYKPVPKGIGLVIGCSTFPIWNTLPGVYANLICGNSVIIKPHPKAILPIAIVVEEIQKTLIANNLDSRLIQLAVDTSSNPITKELVEHPKVTLIDYTGGSEFGNYIESVKGKTVFTEKAGVNSIVVHSAIDLKKVTSNIAFSICLYSGQMCTAPQNIFIPKDGVKTDEGVISVSEFKKMLTESIKDLVNNPKAGAGTLGAIQNVNTFKRSDKIKNLGLELILDKIDIQNHEFPDAVIHSPVIFGINSNQKDIYFKECFGPIAFVVETDNILESIKIAAQSAMENGAITCLAYCTDKEICETIENEMNNSFTPVSFNFEGAAFVNQHAAFSDLHVTGGNPSGNATFTDPNFINRRFVWVGNRYMSK